MDCLVSCHQSVPTFLSFFAVNHLQEKKRERKICLVLWDTPDPVLINRGSPRTNEVPTELTPTTVTLNSESAVSPFTITKKQQQQQQPKDEDRVLTDKIERGHQSLSVGCRKLSQQWQDFVGLRNQSKSVNSLSRVKSTWKKQKTCDQKQHRPNRKISHGSLTKLNVNWEERTRVSLFRESSGTEELNWRVTFWTARRYEITGCPFGSEMP